MYKIRSNKKEIIPFLLCGACLLTAGAAFSQIRDTTTLQEVRVDARRITTGINPSASMQVLSGPQLQRLNSLSVADAMRYFSGVQLKDYGGIGGLKTINVRSMGTNHTAVSYDGLVLGNAQNGQVDLGKFSLDNIAEIALYNGQPATILQPARDLLPVTYWLYSPARRTLMRMKNGMVKPASKPVLPV